MLGGRGDMLDDLPSRGDAILGNFINQAQRSLQILNLQFELGDLLLRMCKRLFHCEPVLVEAPDNRKILTVLPINENLPD